MAQIPAQFWMLKYVDGEGAAHYKPATGTSATPKLYLHEAVARAAGGPKWTAVPISINFL